MKNKPLLVLIFVLAMLLVTIPAAANESQDEGGLQPGTQVTFTQDVPINLVFIGYDQADIDEAALLSVLPTTYDPVVRFPQFYGLSGRDLGLHFDFNYHTYYTEAWFENRFFHYLKKIGEPDDLTLFQQFYNDQANNVLDITGPVWTIDGPTVEKWLNARAQGQLGIDTNTGYTIFFINWYGRSDFQFHVYTKTDQPDPDTGYNFGELRASRKMIAWGGTHSRTWFYDLSAGPEAWTANYDVDNPDLNGNGFEEYRMPPIWEYTAGGYRDPAALSSDLGLITRFVGINMLFTPSPVYDPLVTTPGLFGDKVTHIEMFEDDPGASGLDWIDASVVFANLADFEPYYNWQVHLEDNAPIDAGSERAFRIFNGLLLEDDCWNPYGTTFAELFCYYDANYSAYVPAYADNDYVVPVFAFNTTDANHATGLLGFADDNWTDGTQSYVFQFDTPFFRSLGYGFSNTTIHEVGHHIGLSHPHDGYDAELDLNYGAVDAFYFAWSGDESDTVMHYLTLNNNFGKFNQDTIYRVEMAGYLNWANDLLALILAHPDASKVQNLINGANAQAALAVDNFENWHYQAAVSHAYNALQALLKAADILGIDPTYAALSVYEDMPINTNVLHEGDPIRFPNN